MRRLIENIILTILIAIMLYLGAQLLVNIFILKVY